jgi:uncharacterized protein YnzC (UPF0291/DUF896 family)
MIAATLLRTTCLTDYAPLTPKFEQLLSAKGYKLHHAHYTLGSKLPFGGRAQFAFKSQASSSPEWGVSLLAVDAQNPAKSTFPQTNLAYKHSALVVEGASLVEEPRKLDEVAVIRVITDYSLVTISRRKASRSSVRGLACSEVHELQLLRSEALEMIREFVKEYRPKIRSIMNSGNRHSSVYDPRK